MKKYRAGLAATAVIVTLTVISGAVEGYLSGRWQDTKPLDAAAAGLRQFPKRFGAWHLQHEQHLSSYAQNALQCAGYINRIYKHEQTGATVSVAVLVGPQGPMSVHTPEICYSSRDYKIRGERERIIFRQRDQLWQTTFQPVQAGSGLLNVYYGWNDGHGWSAPAQPRFAFAGAPRLYKLQLASSADDDEGADACQAFLKDCLPVLDQYLLTKADKLR